MARYTLMKDENGKIYAFLNDDLTKDANGVKHPNQRPALAKGELTEVYSGDTKGITDLNELANVYEAGAKSAATTVDKDWREELVAKREQRREAKLDQMNQHRERNIGVNR